MQETILSIEPIDGLIARPGHVDTAAGKKVQTTLTVSNAAMGLQAGTLTEVRPERIRIGGVLGVLSSTPACPVPVHMMPGY